MRAWARGYKRDGRVNRRASGWNCRDRSNSVEGFRVGGVECYGDRLCDPCRHLARLTKDGVLRALSNRGGLRADILDEGPIAIGDLVARV